ncbi:MAG: phosphonate ABC transporter, permease protein PhnE [Erysipelotrichales bacterium]|nr:MAG: phosphonate ABC transporter, permease protein PhnE [Erysipelotrichales bacterium]
MDWVRNLIRPEPLVLGNGKIIQPKMSVMVIVIPILVLAVLFSAYITGFNFITLFRRGYQFFVIVGRKSPPAWSYFPEVIGTLIETIMMSIMGTLIGAFLSLPLAFLSSDNIIKNKAFLWTNRMIVSLFRTMPILIFAFILKYIFGIGTFAGTLSIALFTWLIMTKMLYEIIETVDMGPFEALESSGASRLRAFSVSIIPQILGQYISIALYNFEMNVRSAAILGYVGAGGIGLLINEKLGWRQYDKVGLILLSLLVTVYAIESFSRYVRKKLT